MEDLITNHVEQKLNRQMDVLITNHEKDVDRQMDDLFKEIERRM